MPRFSQYNGYSPIGYEDIQEIECEENITCYGYKRNLYKTGCYHFFSILLFGIPYMIVHWYTQLSAYLKYDKCSLVEAEILLIQLHGENEIVIEVKSYWTLFVEEVFNPFYIFQAFSVILWSLDEYYYYAGCITENKAVEDISATDLVPGDMIVIPSHGCVMACDAVLLSGNCIVNESMLTAVVVRTGFATAKGELVRSILFPKPMSGFKFYQDSIKFVTFLFIIAALGMGYCIYLYIKRQASVVTVLLRTLDIITIVVPPALPAAMTAGTVYSQNRLKKLGIFCISPLRINVSGKVKLVCFDKSEDEKQFELLAAGDVKIPYEIGIVRQFPFGSAVQCMSVIARTLGSEHMTFYTKGAPEKIKSLCSKDTGKGTCKYLFSLIMEMCTYIVITYDIIEIQMPDNFDGLLMQYTLSGYRVIALAYKDLDPKFNWKQAQRVNRDQSDLKFLGLMIMQNTLKPETSPAISQLHLAKIRCVMVTGDNLLTAVSVARDCGMVAPYEHVIKLSVHGDPQQGILKRELIGAPQRISDTTLTPSTALKAAHIGISLSEAEASVAAPFTSRVANITCVLKLIQEGRCALVTSFGIFNLSDIVIAFNIRESILGNMQFLYIDLVITTSIAVVMGRTGPASRLVPKRPMGSLVSAANIIPLLLQVFLTMTVQLATLYYLMKQPW
ncbi:hypothetical protein C0J52_15360 [Blattella germanica]|nr:hypothetical protein C0J52_15360 [Blattella germanica]